MKGENRKFTFGDNNHKKYRKRGETSLAKFTSSNGRVIGTLMLDPRRMKGDLSQEAQVAVRVAFEGKKIFLHIGKSYVGTDWVELCENEKLSRNKKASERRELKAMMEKVAFMVDKLIDDGCFSLQRLKDVFQGREINDEDTIYSIWEDFIKEKEEQRRQEQLVAIGTS